MQSLWIIFAIFGASLILVQASCPFSKQKPDDTKFDAKGHHKPFGYHAKHWKRVETVYEHPDPETFYNKYVRASKPLIIRGGAADWPAIHKWKNLSYINEFGGNERSTVLWKGIYNYDKFHPIRIDMTMKEFTSKFDSNLLYMDATMQTGLLKDMYWPASLGCKFFLKRVKQFAIMMNSGKSKSPLHIDATDTYFIQVTGTRLWLMSPPTQAQHTYSGHPHLVDHSGISILNQTLMDLEKFPGASQLDIHAAYINPGDIVYVPESWYHQVITDGKPNIGAPVFLNIMFCEYQRDSSYGNDDIAYVHNCFNKVRAKKPQSLKCDKFPTEKITIEEMLKREQPRNLDAFSAVFGEETTPVNDRHLRYRHRLSDGSYINALGMSLTGMSQEALENESVLKQGVIEGYRLYCTSPDDGSEPALGRLLSRRPKIRKQLSILSLLPLSFLSSASSIPSAIDDSLRALKTSKIDFLLLQGPDCRPNFTANACTRDQFNDVWAQAWAALESVQRQGKIRFLGLSDFSLSEVKQFKAKAKLPITIVRARFDLYFRNALLRNFCKQHRIHFMGRSVLGRRWKEEAPDFPLNRDVFQEHTIKKMAYLYKTSIHAAVYDWAIKKNVIICPKVNDPLHVRVNVKAIDSESVSSPGNVYAADGVDPTDTSGLHVPGAQASDFSHQSFEEEDVTREQIQEKGGREQSKAEQRFGENNSNQEYTDDKDFETFPTYMLGSESD